MSTFSSPNASTSSSRPGIQVVHLSQGQVSQYQGRQSFDIVVRERNEMESFITCLAMSRQQAKRKMESYSILKIEVKDQLKCIYDRLMQLDQYENLVNQIANRWDELIDVNYIPKTPQMQIIVTMTNELKMLVKILKQGRNVEEFQNSRFSPYCSDFFNAAIKARNNSQILMRILEDIKQNLLQMKNQGKIKEELYEGVTRAQPMNLFRQWGMLLQQEIQSLFRKSNQQEATIQMLKRKLLQHEKEYNRLADELYKQKVSQERRQPVENNQKQEKRLADRQSEIQTLQSTLQLSQQKIAKLQLCLNQSNSNYSRLFSQMQAKEGLWKQQRESLIRNLQAINSQLKLNKDQQQLQRSKDQLMKEKSHLQVMLNQKNELLDMESKKVAALNIMINQNEQSKRRLEQELGKERTINSSLKLKELQPKLEDLKLQNSIFSTQLAESKTSIERLTIQNSNLSKERQLLIEQKKRLFASIKSQHSPITIPTSPKRLEQTTRTINELNLTIKKLQARLRSKEEQLEDSYQQVQSLNRMMQDMNQLGSSRTDNSALISQYEQKIQNMERRTAELQKNANAQADLSSKLRETVKMKNEEIVAFQGLLRQAQQKTADMKMYNMILSDLRQQNGKLKQALEQSYQKLKNLQAGPDGSSISRVNCLFQNDILENEPQHKRYLTEVIQSYMRMKIQKTRLVYAFDSNNKTNIHKYIDGKDNLVFIIKMLNGTYTAAYTEGPFQPRQASDRQGLIIALSRHKYFTLNEPNRRAITYDDYYIIFGNSEIRLRSQQKKLFSNFGISNSYYKSQGQRVTVLLGGSPQQRQLELDHYEVYQITFDV